MSHRRAVAWGLGISVALHLLFFLISTKIWFSVPEFGPMGQVAPRPEPGGRVMQAVEIAVSTEAVPEEEEPPPPQNQPVTPRPTTSPRRTFPDAVSEGDAAPADTRSPADLLRPQMGDPRLWIRPGAPEEPEKTDIERVRERVYSRIEALNDSLGAVAAAAERATDWTVTDKDGNKWGVSPGKIHLGGKTLPLPFGFSAPPEKQQEGRDRARKDAEVDRQSDRARIRESFEDRNKAIRERKDRERAEKKPVPGTTSD